MKFRTSTEIQVAFRNLQDEVYLAGIKISNACSALKTYTDVPITISDMVHESLGSLNTAWRIIDDSYPMHVAGTISDATEKVRKIQKTVCELNKMVNTEIWNQEQLIKEDKKDEKSNRKNKNKNL